MRYLLDSETVTITYEPENKTVFVNWKGGQTAAQYREALELVLAEIKKEAIDNYLSDNRLQAVVSPAERKWFEEYVMPTAQADGLKRGAVVIPADIFKQYYMNKIKEKSVSIQFELRLFGNMTDAKNWIKSFYTE